MGVYIKDMEMPKGKDVLMVAITADGEVYSIGFDNTIEGGIFLSYPSTYPIQAVPVLPHGRLIDADKLKTAFPCGESVRTECVRATIDHAFTIIEADENDNG